MTLANIGEMLREILAAVKGAPALANDLAASRVEASDLKTKLSATEAERDSLKAGLDAKEGEATAAKAEAEKAAADVKAANEAKEKAESALKDLESNPSKQAVEIAAKAGVKASALPKGDVKSANTVSSDEFKAMSNAQKMAFSKAGGRIA